MDGRERERERGRDGGSSRCKLWLWSSRHSVEKIKVVRKRERERKSNEISSHTLTRICVYQCINICYGLRSLTHVRATISPQERTTTTTTETIDNRVTTTTALEGTSEFFELAYYGCVLQDSQISSWFSTIKRILAMTHDRARHDTAWHEMKQHRTARHDTTRHGTNVVALGLANNSYA